MFGFLGNIRALHNVASAVCLLAVCIALLPNRVIAETIDFRSKAFGVLPKGRVEGFLGAAGVNRLPDNDVLQRMGIGWVRKEVSWANSNPAQGIYDWTQIDTYMQEAGDLGVKVLLMVRNTPDWARVVQPYSFESLGISWEISPTIDPVSGFANGYWVNRVDAQTGLPVTDYPDDPVFVDTPSQLRMQDSEEFVAFVEALVERYSKAPYYIEYLQIANEHRPEADQYPIDGTAEVAERWFVPAAERIHARYPYMKLLVCWPTNVKDEQIDAFESVPGALEQMDIYAQHYGGIDRWRNIFERYTSLGRPDIWFWATEFGSVTTEGNPWKVTHDYPAIFELALKQGWKDEDRFKLFWWPFTGNADPPKALTWQSDKEMTLHGEQVRAFYSLLGDRPRRYTEIVATPDPSDTDYLAGFRTDTGYLVAVGLENWSGGDQLTIELPRVRPRAIREARVVDGYGNILDRPPTLGGGRRGIGVDIDLTRLRPGATAFYVQFLAL